MRLQESGEMYLETILVLSQKLEHVRSLDVAEYMGFSKPSVSRAVGLLKTAGYLLMDPTGYLTLTDSGRTIAERIYERHVTLTQFLISVASARVFSTQVFSMDRVHSRTMYLPTCSEDSGGTTFR